ncbi:LytR/AlgR family response regulator transcription factor [Polaribacter porphyrae]|uniref:LytR/AlgR family response regulator transcription factor n=1 Tax=Polaribacter porphyrae TaxID=1137780 RepID=UPI000CF404F9|nr:LytTR family DNA-binding domain-containing protein [Polaribacter porphyrae]
MISCIILEDEESAQEVLQSYVDKTPFIECLGVFESGLDIPLKLLQKADVLFLDIQLPELTGLSFLKTIPIPQKVIVTTAYKNYAIEAFEEAVTDYLLKPFSYERFFKAITRIRNQQLAYKKVQPKELFLYADKTIYKIDIDEILYVKAEIDYVKIVTTAKKILILDSLKNWKEKLLDFRFIQVHRSYIVNISKISKVYGNLVYIDKEPIAIGKKFKSQFLKEINH